MRLKKLIAHNFRLLEDFEIEFHPDVTVLIGPNYVGKSSVVEAIVAAARGFASNNLAISYGTGVSHHDRQRCLSIELQLAVEDGSSFWCFVQLTADGFHGWRVYGDSTRSQALQPEAIPPNLRDFLSKVANVDAFRNVSFVANVAPKETIAASGFDLPQILHYQYTNNREGFDGYEANVAKVLPDLDIIETPLIGPGQTTTQIRFHGDPTKYDLASLSSGIKDVLVLIAAVHFSSPGSLVLIEEPENHLHPAAQKALCSVMVELARKEQKQFVLTTHSEFILSQFAPEQSVFIERFDSGAKATPLAQVDAFSAWQRLGIDRSKLLEVLGRTRQVVVITEARDDAKLIEVLGRESSLTDKLLTARAEGGGSVEIITYAAQLRDDLKRFRIPSAVFVLLDNDGERDVKMKCLKENDFDANTSHVWYEKEVESYLLLPGALAAISGKSKAEVEAVIARANGAGKARLQWVLSELGMAGTPLDVIATNAYRNDPDKLPPEFAEVVEKLRRLC